MLKYIGIIEGKDVRETKWFKTRKQVDDWMAAWMRDHPDRPYCRYTIAECIWTIEG